jgi:hypothetical protein
MLRVCSLDTLPSLNIHGGESPVWRDVDTDHFPAGERHLILKRSTREVLFSLP